MSELETRITHPLTVARERVAVLESRRDYLSAKIRERGRGIHRQRHERAALCWVLDLARVEVERLADEVTRELRRLDGGDER